MKIKKYTHTVMVYSVILGDAIGDRINELLCLIFMAIGFAATFPIVLLIVCIKSIKLIIGRHKLEKEYAKRWKEKIKEENKLFDNESDIAIVTKQEGIPVEVV